MSSLVNVFTQFIYGLYNLTDAVGFPSYALAIIFLGLIVRVILLPLTIMQMKSMIGMTDIQPELQQLQQKYANNREKLSEEMMKLYKEYNVKPAAGCLPILIQLPILYILFYAIRSFDFANAEHANFFWISSLNDKDPTFILPIILGLVMFIQQKLAMSINKSTMQDNPMNATMKMMVYVMPVMFFFSATMMPSGLVIYWLTTTTFMVFQQLLMNRIRRKEMAKRAEERAARIAAREKEKEEEKKRGQNKSKKKTKQQLKNEHKAKKRAANSEYQAPGKENTHATYHAPKKK